MCNETLNLCVGKEWYRFTSHYFLPNNVNLRFIKQGRQSQLPQYYPSTAAEIQPNFNDQNRDEESRYIDVSGCHYVVEYDEKGNIEKSFPLPKWTILVSFPFVNTTASSSLFRAFYIPFYSSRYTKWQDYVLIQNVYLKCGTN
eukprot:TRINITY_DN5052_c0_g1_i7.p1 TRINITY_DN5052_c0_g1~~TRINITY_DN5052_c0_g1_i7.p1  ORF type:complete len:143 (+),score=9.04 TRINITY_DN5052_c0_g1_i7:151-579(+)